MYLKIKIDLEDGYLFKLHVQFLRSEEINVVNEPKVGCHVVNDSKVT